MGYYPLLFGLSVLLYILLLIILALSLCIVAKISNYLIILLDQLKKLTNLPIKYSTKNLLIIIYGLLKLSQILKIGTSIGPLEEKKRIV